MSSAELRASFKTLNLECLLMALFAEMMDYLDPPPPVIYEIEDELGYYYGVEKKEGD